MRMVKEEILKKRTIGDESVRLFHGRGQCYPGYDDIVIDWFRPVILITLYRSRDDAWLCQLVVLLRSLLNHIQTIVLQERFIRDSPSRILFGQLPDQVNAVESELKYRLRLNSAQNVGFFIDMKQGRSLVRKRSEGKKVLNLFSYSCSFSVAALFGGANHVVNLDMNRSALELGKLNHQINQIDLRKASFLQFEFFKSISKLRKLAPFDLIICDPPTDQGGSFYAPRDWPKLAKKLPTLLGSEGEMILCLSSPYLTPEWIQSLVVEYCPQASLLDTFFSGDDFPELVRDKGLNLLLYKINSVG